MDLNDRITAQLTDLCCRVFGASIQVDIQWQTAQELVFVTVTLPTRRDLLTQSMQEMDVILAANTLLAESAWSVTLRLLDDLSSKKII